MGESVLEFAYGNELVILNTVYRKREDHYKTLKGGILWTVLCGKVTLKINKDNKVISEEIVVTKYRFMLWRVLELWCKGRRVNNMKG